MEATEMRFVGVVHLSQEDQAAVVPFQNPSAIIEIFPEYAGALKNINQHSHLWIISWFHQANREVIEVSPKHIDPNAPVFGVFGLRTPARPNPIGLSLVKLEQVEGRNLFVQGLDAIDGTPILDIKPYFEQDIIFSPRAPYIRPQKKDMRYQMFYAEALRHHQEECEGFFLALRMAVIAEEEFGKLNSSDLLVTVTGSPCLADTIQGLTRARIANPQRFKFQQILDYNSVFWKSSLKKMVIKVKDKMFTKDDIINLPDEEVFEIYLAKISGH